jgi:hypothetical protein
VCENPYFEYSKGKCCQDLNNNKICDSAERQAIRQEPQAAEQEIACKAGGRPQLPDTNLTVAELERFISTTSGVEYSFKSGDDRYTSEARARNQFLFASDNTNKWWVIHRLSGTKLDDISCYYSFVRSPSWQAWRYYINDTVLKTSYRPLSPEELSGVLPGYSYLRYLNQDSKWVDIDVYEEPISVPEGIVLQYRLEMLVHDQYGHVQYNWQPPVVLYKVPCTKNIVVYIRPQFGLDFGNAVVLNLKKEGFLENWMREIERQKPSMLNYSSQIMQFCGVNKSMFWFDFDKYENHYELVSNQRVYYRLLFNYSLEANFSLKDAGYDDYYKFRDVNVTFVNRDDNVALSNTHLSVKIVINDSGEIIDYLDTSLIGGTVGVGERVNKYISIPSRDMFRKNSTVLFLPYIGTPGYFEGERYYIGPPIAKRVMSAVQ